MATERTNAVTVYLTDDEQAAWKAGATAAGRGQLAAWVRDTVNDSLSSEAATDDGNELRQMADDVARTIRRAADKIDHSER